MGIKYRYAAAGKGKISGIHIYQLEYLSRKLQTRVCSLNDQATQRKIPSIWCEIYLWEHKQCKANNACPNCKKIGYFAT